MFGKIGSFLKDAVLGVFEAFGETFAFAPAPKKAPSAAAPGETLEPQDLAAEPQEPAGAAPASGVEPPAKTSPTDDQPAEPRKRARSRPAESRKSARAAPRGKPSAPAAVAARENSAGAAAPDGRAKNSGEPPASESPVAQRYRTLKAEGLTPKEANEFSRSAKKYAAYRRLSTTRAHDGAKTQWDILKEFDRKAALHLAQLEKAGEDAASFKVQAAAARDALIANYLGDKEAGSRADPRRVSGETLQENPRPALGQAETIAKMIGLEIF